jgi:hypothetical protein
MCHKAAEHFTGQAVFARGFDVEFVPRHRQGVGKRETILLVLLFVAALALRLFRLANQSLWMDELSSIETARVPTHEIFARSAQNNALPAYFLLLRPIVGKTDEHIEVRSRLISALAGALSVPVFAGLVFCWYRRWPVAITGGVLLAFNPLHLWYSQEARGYALMLLLGLCCLLCFELARGRDSGRWWAGYIAAAILAAAVHKTGLVFPLACALWDVWVVWRAQERGAAQGEHEIPSSGRRPNAATLISRLSPHLVLVAIAVLLLIEPSQPPAREYGRPNSILEIGYTAMTFLGGYSFGPSLTDLQNQGPKIAVLHHLVQTVILVGALGFFGAVAVWRWRSVLRTRAALLMILPILVGFAGAALSNFPYNVRYTLPALFGFLGLLAAAPSIIAPSRLARVLIAMVVAVNLWADGQWFFKENYRKGDSRAVARWLVQHEAQVKSWTALPDYLAYSIKWYLKDHPDVVARVLPPKESQTTSFPPVPDVLIIGRRHHVKDPDAVINAFRASVGEVRVVKSFAGFELYARPENK